MDGKVICGAENLFVPIEENLKMFMPSEVRFQYNNTIHTLAVIGDKISGSTREMALFVLDDMAYNSLDNLKQFAQIDGEFLISLRGPVEILTVDGENACLYIPFAQFIEGNSKLREKNLAHQQKLNATESYLAITKKNMLWQVVKLWVGLFGTFALLISVFMTIVGFLYREVNGFTFADYISIWVLIFGFFAVMGFFCSLKGILELSYIKNQERVLGIQVEQALAGQYMAKKGQICYYQSPEWFISIYGNTIIVFCRSYITGISPIYSKQYRHRSPVPVTQYQVEVQTIDGNKKRITVPHVGEYILNNLKGWYESDPQVYQNSGQQ